MHLLPFLLLPSIHYQQRWASPCKPTAFAFSCLLFSEQNSRIKIDLYHIYIFVHIHTDIQRSSHQEVKDLVSLQCPSARCGKARRHGLPLGAPGVCSVEPGPGGGCVSNSPPSCLRNRRGSPGPSFPHTFK